MVLEPESRPLTAFVTPWGLFQWTVLPMWLRTAPQANQTMVQLCWEETGLKPYIDDVLRGTPNTEDNPDLDAPVTDGCLGQHYEDLCQILTCLRDWQLSIRPSKAFLSSRRLCFCGQILERGRRSADPQKVAAVSRWDWQDIWTPTHLKAFLGLAEWYPFYIDKSSDYAAPLTDALRGLDSTRRGEFKSRDRALSTSRRKAVFQQFFSVTEAEIQICRLENRIHWKPEMIWHFQQLKEKLFNPVQLYIPDPQTPVTLRLGVCWSSAAANVLSLTILPRAADVPYFLWHFFGESCRGISSMANVPGQGGTKKLVPLMRHSKTFTHGYSSPDFF